ncbi:MAG: sigma-70 family RNA polymerase sigma factor [Pseudomonadota bacterium]
MKVSVRHNSQDQHGQLAGSPESRSRAESGVPPQQPTSNIARLYEDYAVQLSATLRKRYGDGPPDPDDIAQAAFEKVLERGDTASIRNLKAFLWSTARNLLRKEIRSKHVRDRYAFDIDQIFFAAKGDDRTPERVIEAKQQLKSINALLRHMPERRRQALILHRIDGLSVAEVGRRMGIGRTAAAKHVARALADIDAMLADEAEL